VLFKEYAFLINHNFSCFLHSVGEENSLLPEVMKTSYGPQGLNDAARNTGRERHFSGKQILRTSLLVPLQPAGRNMLLS
jgi:hypothetical protein